MEDNKNILDAEIIEKAKKFLASKSNREWVKAFKKLEKEEQK